MISLIVATVQRTTELERLLISLDRQSYKDFEVIVVDQNPDNQLVPVLRKHKNLSIQHLRTEPGASRARNLGLRAAKGDIIAIPDDDCWYPDHLLATVTGWFETHPEFDGLFTSLRTSDNKPMTPKWAPGPCNCTKKNVWHCAGAVTAFMREGATKTVGFFNESFGPGTPSRYQSGEDMDYFIRLIERGSRVWYEPSVTVYHPELQTRERLQRTSYSYALGIGYVLRVHKYSQWYLSKLLMRSMGGVLLSLCKADGRLARAYILRALGQLKGYVLGPRDFRKLAKKSNSVMANTA